MLVRCLVIGLVACAVVVTASVSCLDENGKAVDYWYMIKFPEISSSSNPVAQKGYGYAYIMAGSHSWTISSNTLDKGVGALGNTLAQIYKGSSSLTWLMYDDETPTGSVEDDYGHTKGEVAFDSTSGFWLIHSVPRFPVAPPGPYSFPADESKYGQSFLCTTYRASEFENIAANFLLNKPYVYASQASSSVLSKYPNLSLVLSKKWNTAPNATQQNLVTQGGHTFISFAKSSQWNSDLYEFAVSPGLDTDLSCETWQDGIGDMPDYCPPSYTYTNVDVRQVTIDSSTGIQWVDTDDHSKWVISTSKNDAWVCIGDINRQSSQAGRGGGTLCNRDSYLWTAFSTIATQIDSCS